MKDSRLSAKALNELANRYVQGYSAKDLAAEYGISPSTVLYWVRKIAGEDSTRGKKRTDDETQALAVVDYLERQETGDTTRAIAERYGVSPPTVIRWVKHLVGGEHVAPSCRESHDDDTRRQAVEEYLEGSSARQLARRYGTSPTTIINWVTDAAGKDNVRGVGRRKTKRVKETQ